MASGFGCVVLIATACLIQMVLVAKQKVYFVDFERVNLTYWNPKYIKYVNVTAQRYGRKDPIHYVHFYVETLATAEDNLLVDYYVYEFLSNEYRRSFVEAHFKVCDLFFKNKIFGPLITKQIPGLPKSCPVEKGVFRAENLSIIDLPLLRTFPFQKGRMFVNVTGKVNGVLERVGDGYIDAAIKQIWR